MNNQPTERHSPLRPLIERVLPIDPDRTALIIDGTVTSYRQLLNLVDGAAFVLSEAGVRPGHRVAVAEEATLLGIVTALAAMEIGAAAALMNPRLTSPELQVLANAAEVCDVGVAGDRFRSTLSDAGIPLVLGAEELLVGSTSETVVPGPAVEGAAAVVLFTSGTTGTPKAIAMTSTMVRDRVLFYSPEVEVQPTTALACTPLPHIGGVLPILNTLGQGGRVVVQKKFEAGEWLELVDRHQVNRTFVVPTMLHRIISHPTLPDRDLGSMRLLSFGAAPASPDLIRKVQEAFPGAMLANTFGQTETMGSLTMFDPRDQTPERLSSVGQPMPGVEARVVDPSTGIDVALGEVGELWVKTPTMVIPPDQRADPILPEGWFRTGDLVTCDDEGFLYPVGRRSDTINRGGEKFPPLEIEDVVRRHPALLDAAVFGVPDDELGMRVGVAAVVREPLSLEDLRSYCIEFLAPYKLPEQLLVLDEIPYNDFGKIDRKVLRRLAESANAS